MHIPKLNIAAKIYYAQRAIFDWKLIFLTLFYWLPEIEIKLFQEIVMDSAQRHFVDG
jgi:hypothetical protein